MGGDLAVQAPVPPSSGRTNRHRLSRGGDRAANAALYGITLVRMSSDSRSREYVARQTAAGRTKKEIMRILKRAIAREIFRCLTSTVSIPGITDLRPLRQSKNITLTAAARHFGVWPATISTLERGIRRDGDLAHVYRDWLHAACPFDANTSLIDSGGLKRSGRERPVPAFRELLPDVLVPARRVTHQCRKRLKEAVEFLVLPFVSPAEVVLTQFSNEGDQFVAAADFVTGTVLAGLFTGDIAVSHWSARQTARFHEAVTVSPALTVVAAALVGWAVRQTHGAADDRSDTPGSDTPRGSPAKPAPSATIYWWRHGYG